MDRDVALAVAVVGAATALAVVVLAVVFAPLAH